MIKIRAAITDAISHLAFWSGLIGALQMGMAYLQAPLADHPFVYGGIMISFGVATFVFNFTQKLTLSEKASNPIETCHDDGTASG